MVIELAVVLLLLATGVLLLQAVGWSGWAVLPLGWLVGLAVHVAVIHVQAVLRIPTSALFPLALVTAVAALAWLFGRRSGRAVPFDPLVVAVTVVAVAGVVVVAWEANLVRYHYDSIRYLVATSVIAQGDIASLSENLFMKRLSSASLLNTYAFLGDGFYLRSLIPLTSLSTLATLYWVLQVGLPRVTTVRRAAPVAGVLGIGLLVSNYGYLWHSFYINGHLLFAAFALMATGAAWLLALEVAPPRVGLVVMMLAGVVGALLSREEAPLLVALVLVPVLLTPAIDLRVRRLLALTAGVTILLEQALLATLLGRIDLPVESEVQYLAVLGLVLVVVAPVLGAGWVRRSSRLLVWIAEAGLWVALGIYAVADDDVLRDSAVAEWTNFVLGDGLWGLAIVTTVALVVWALVRPPFPHRSILRFPVSAFLPMAFLLAYLREGAFRAGPYDSMNRIVLQVVPLAVLFVMVAVSAERGAPADDERGDLDPAPRDVSKVTA
ncbi:hypothetical protein [Salsipaludibacter albus]|uniref:hypothetical protein n=1 Tax=Salsipaludibacter albus TaxID=2849650 RepID=UPI001EE40939|nr:hypothetical protein [Salsipaludibacter albus]MBY5161213.1 hypothetical protein [Salsipaludibacter albus]